MSTVSRQQSKIRKSIPSKSMTKETRRIPDWAIKERSGDLAWIRENLHGFWASATAAFAGHGRGLIVVDTRIQIEGAGHPFGYIVQEDVEQHDDEDAKRLVRQYRPERELVIMLLKGKGKTSTYRVQAF